MLTKILLLLVLSLRPGAWSFQATNLFPDFAPAGGGLAFNFPNEDGTNPRVDYFWTGQTKPIAGNISATFQVVTSSPAVVFNYNFEPGNTCVYPAHVRLILARNDWAATGKKTPADYQNTRWWSNPIAAELVGGSTVQLNVPLAPEQWSNIYGETGTAEPAGFNQALAKPGMVGFSFGGGCFFGHGVNVSGGTAEFIVWGLAIG
jgi:hypothetical protein